MQRTNLVPSSACAIARDVRTGELSAVRSVELALTRLKAGKKEVSNAFVTLSIDQAFAQAQEVDRRVKDGADMPLAGVPVSVKDTISTAGIRTTGGSLLLKDWVPDTDATAVAQLKAAGAVVLGKTNCPEFGNDIQTSNRVHGTTHNPLNVNLVPGGSSGGDAAAVSAGLVPVGIGTDFGGSVRWPAQCTGTFGIRPTEGLVPGDGQWGPDGGDASLANTWSLQGRLQTIGPIARTIEDLELVMRVLAGGELPDALSAGETRAIWLDGEGSVPVHRDLVAAVHLAAGRLAKSGITVSAADPSLLAHAENLFTRMREMDGLASVRHLADGRETELTPMIRKLISRPDTARLADFLDAGQQREQLRVDVLGSLGRDGVLILPVSAVPAFPVGADRFAVDGVELKYWQALAPSRAISLLGLPALSVPVTQLDDGTWASVQIVGRPGSEAQLFGIGRLLTDLGQSR